MSVVSIESLRGAACVALLCAVGCASGEAAEVSDLVVSERPHDAFVRDGEGGWRVLRPEAGQEVPEDGVLPGEEKHLANLRMLTFTGQNAEAYWSFDDRELIFQGTFGDIECDQIFLLDVASGAIRQVTNSGRTTCPYFIPGSDRVMFASTHERSPDCPPPVDRSRGYVWPLHPYDIYTADRDGTNLVNITNTSGYDAEATISRDGRVVFTSDRSGDLELWTMNVHGGDLKQITDRPGYDGGAFFSPDGSKLVWRSTRFDSDAELDEYRGLLAQRLVRPAKMEIWVADADGSNARQLTDNGRANFAPYYTPDGSAVLFSSNLNDPRGRIFEIWKITLASGELERITYNEDSFDGFPMFSWDGKRIAFSSNRFGARPGETNVFVADWRP